MTSTLWDVNTVACIALGLRGTSTLVFSKNKNYVCKSYCWHGITRYIIIAKNYKSKRNKRFKTTSKQRLCMKVGIIQESKQHMNGVQLTKHKILLISDRRIAKIKIDNLLHSKIWFKHLKAQNCLISRLMVVSCSFHEKA